MVGKNNLLDIAFCTRYHLPGQSIALLSFLGQIPVW